MAMKCPECGKPAHTRSSNYLSDVTKATYYQCKNIYCSCTFTTLESLDKIICRMPKNSESQPHPLEKSNSQHMLGKYGNSFQMKDRHQQP